MGWQQDPLGHPGENNSLADSQSTGPERHELGVGPGQEPRL